MTLAAAWAIVTGAMRTVLAVRLRKEIEGEFWLGLSGLFSVLFGFLMMARPDAGVLAVLWLIATWSIVIGLSLILVAFRVRGLWPKDAAVPAATN